MHYDHLLIPVTSLRNEGHNPAAKTRLLSFDRMQSRVVISLLTGHNTLRRYLDKIRLTNSPVCRRCRAVEETPRHVLCECEAFVTLTHTLCSFFSDPEDVKWLSMGDIWNFIKGTGLPWLALQPKGHKEPVKDLCASVPKWLESTVYSTLFHSFHSSLCSFLFPTDRQVYKLSPTVI